LGRSIGLLQSAKAASSLSLGQARQAARPLQSGVVMVSEILPHPRTYLRSKHGNDGERAQLSPALDFFSRAAHRNR
jgi:hypothetical protein